MQSSPERSDADNLDNISPEKIKLNELKKKRDIAPCSSPIQVFDVI